MSKIPEDRKALFEKRCEIVKELRTKVVESDSDKPGTFDSGFYLGAMSALAYAQSTQQKFGLTKEQAYQQATLELLSDSTGTRMDIIYRAMDIYAASTQQGGEGEEMTDKRRIRIMRNALDTIQAEAAEPIIRVYAQSALDETIEPMAKIEGNANCKKHNWYGKQNEKCPLCSPSTSDGEKGSLPSWVTDESGPEKY